MARSGNFLNSKLYFKITFIFLKFTVTSVTGKCKNLFKVKLQEIKNVSHLEIFCTMQFITKDQSIFYLNLLYFELFNFYITKFRGDSTYTHTHKKKNQNFTTNFWKKQVDL